MICAVKQWKGEDEQGNDGKAMATRSMATRGVEMEKQGIES